MTTVEQVPDFTIRNAGSVWVFCPLTKEAKEWFGQNVSFENYQSFGNAVTVEHRYALPLVNGIQEAGFKVA